MNEIKSAEKIYVTFTNICHLTASRHLNYVDFKVLSIRKAREFDITSKAIEFNVSKKFMKHLTIIST